METHNHKCYAIQSTMGTKSTLGSFLGKVQLEVAHNKEIRMMNPTNAIT